MSDLIKREDAIEELADYMYEIALLKADGRLDTMEHYLNRAKAMLKRIPSADRPQGEWIYCEDYVGHDGYECSNCGFFIPWVYDYYADSNFILNYHTCPHCDARMKEQKITE